MERAEIIREKGTNRARFFRGQVDKYTWVDVGSSYLPGEMTAAYLYAQLEHGQEINGGKVEVVEYVPPRSGSIGRTGGAAASVRSGALHA